MGNFQNDGGMKSPFFNSFSSGTNFYEVLEIPTDATKIQVREAYIRLKSTYSNGSQALYSLISDEDAKNTLENLEEAYRVLYDEILRKEYDDTLAVVGSAETHQNISGGDDLFHPKPAMSLRMSSPRLRSPLRWRKTKSRGTLALPKSLWKPPRR